MRKWGGAGGAPPRHCHHKPSEAFFINPRQMYLYTHYAITPRFLFCHTILINQTNKWYLFLFIGFFLLVLMNILYRFTKCILFFCGVISLHTKNDYIFKEGQFKSGGHPQINKYNLNNLQGILRNATNSPRVGNWWSEWWLCRTLPD